MDRPCLIIRKTRAGRTKLLTTSATQLWLKKVLLTRIFALQILVKQLAFLRGLEILTIRQSRRVTESLGRMFCQRSKKMAKMFRVFSNQEHSKAISARLPH